jgi:hypothetical protein
MEEKKKLLCSENLVFSPYSGVLTHKRTFGTQTHNWNDIKIFIKEIGCQNENWINLD